MGFSIREPTGSQIKATVSTLSFITNRGDILLFRLLLRLISQLVQNQAGKKDDILLGFLTFYQKELKENLITSLRAFKSFHIPINFEISTH